MSHVIQLNACESLSPLSGVCSRMTRLGREHNDDSNMQSPRQQRQQHMMPYSVAKARVHIVVLILLASIGFLAQRNKISSLLSPSLLQNKPSKAQ